MQKRLAYVPPASEWLALAPTSPLLEVSGGIGDIGWEDYD